ncbi:hypothetical protein [Algihabitans albus]|uniref:hypothetical protein n=1 Tax=Algihabitans albus TaxID=2164067 RepID=UPI000E5CB463|nr:hypothetical protein [Algihabitans albus]
MSDATRKEQWHLDKRISTALILTLLAYGGIALWWASGIEQRVTVMEREQIKTSAALQAVPERLARRWRRSWSASKRGLSRNE